MVKYKIPFIRQVNDYHVHLKQLFTVGFNILVWIFISSRCSRHHITTTVHMFSTGLHYIALAVNVFPSCLHHITTAFIRVFERSTSYNHGCKCFQEEKLFFLSFLCTYSNIDCVTSYLSDHLNHRITTFLIWNRKHKLYNFVFYCYRYMNT